MSPPEIVTYLVSQGYRVGFEPPSGIVLAPEPPQNLRTSFLAKYDDLVAYFQGLPELPASGHAFTVYPGSNTIEQVKEYCVCIACGIPWALHGQPPDSAWLMAADPEKIEAITASPIDVAAVTC